MITLNLVEPSLKKSAVTEKLLSLIKGVVFFLAIISTLIGLVIFIAHQLLAKNYAELKQQAAAVSVQNQSFNQNVAIVNNKLRAVDSLQKDFIRWSEILSALNATVPSGVEFSNLSLNKKDSYLEISGFASRRDDFLSFQQNLEQSGLVTNLNSPLTNLLNQKNITFAVSAKLNLTK
jgi:Tfp pilus assembly protein PilN